ncbi:30S ribosomal protein S13 [Candidatus Woesebacteria bacterium RIFCSPHIGHO2_01_FULL_44_21]|uniref:Small ribosomal subunit protein uS13 n=1 Tax=Candidatus Woesebacteria bacterium RIFCSPHIGHO2_01_FULL_44_21 TaxID=1802503 RepID=A0A1F7Z2S2_9BACT|nr:MAG: 30S ribosomal protein S13 [Candidatus Woesebacteria bacterium RIFCSPHIGHO2_01_FULL_44_21]OGM71466.1 MAG: 30S ribosomal protein S13 [Candidatus Woesebacteria bacterium RIFCSPLOWO2_01_FULL_44_24b]
MARISGVELPENARIDWALTRIKGIGWSSSVKVLGESGVTPDSRVKDLTIEQISAITAALEKYPTEGDLVRSVRGNIQRLKDIASYRGIRHGKGLPVRGQRTRSNARTKRGKRKTVGSFRKEMMTKTPDEAQEKKE